MSPDPIQRPRGAISPLAEALGVVGDRWSLLIVAALLEGPCRFGELQERVEGIASNVLSQRLRSLEGHGVVVSRPYSERPPRMEYELTATGAELAGVLRLLAAWGARGAGGAEAGLPRHGRCGTPLQAVWWCPTCEVVVEDPGEDADLVHL